MGAIKEALKEMRKQEFAEDGYIYNDDEIVCPHCFHEFTDSWEYCVTQDPDKDHEVECQRCGEKFICSSYTTVTYKTFRKNS